MDNIIAVVVAFWYAFCGVGFRWLVANSRKDCWRNIGLVVLLWPVLLAMTGVIGDREND